MVLNIPHHEGQPLPCLKECLRPWCQDCQIWTSRLCVLETGHGAETIYYETSPAGVE